MTQEELAQWAQSNGWKLIEDHPSLTKPNGTPIVRMVLKATLAAIEIRKPSGKWDKVSSAAYAKIMADEDGFPRGLGLDTIYGLAKLMEENKYRAVFAKMSAPKS
jgi:hypothetical protein